MKGRCSSKSSSSSTMSCANATNCGVGWGQTRHSRAGSLSSQTIKMKQDGTGSRHCSPTGKRLCFLAQALPWHETLLSPSLHATVRLAMHPHLPRLLKPEPCQQRPSLLSAFLEPVVQHLGCQLAVRYEPRQHVQPLSTRQQRLHARDLGHTGCAGGGACRRRHTSTTTVSSWVC